VNSTSYTNSLSIPAHTFRSQDDYSLAVPAVSTVIGRQGCATPSMWNEIIVKIRNSPSSASFEKHLKTRYLCLPLVPPHHLPLATARASDSALVMVALCNWAGHYIFALWFLSFFLLLFFPCLISAVGDWMSTILPHMVWP